MKYLKRKLALWLDHPLWDVAYELGFKDGRKEAYTKINNRLDAYLVGKEPK